MVTEASAARLSHAKVQDLWSVDPVDSEDLQVLR